MKEFVRTQASAGWLGGTKVNMATNEMMDKFDSDKNERHLGRVQASAKHALP